jgi:hypothetical protein
MQNGEKTGTIRQTGLGICRSHATKERYTTPQKMKKHSMKEKHEKVIQATMNI